MKLKNKLFILFLVITVIPLFFISTMFYFNAQSYLSDLMIRDLNHVADLKDEKISKFFDEVKKDLEVAQGYFNIKENLPIVSGFFDDKQNPKYIAAKKMLDDQLLVLQDKKNFIDVMLVNKYGRIVYSSNPDHESKSKEFILDDFQFGIFENAKKEIYFSDPYKRQSDKYGYKSGILAAAPVSDFNGKFAGEIIFELDMNQIYELIRVSGEFAETEEVLIGKKNNGNEILILNNLRYEKDTALNKKILIGDIFGVSMQKAVQGETGSGLQVDYRGAEVLANWRQLRYFGWGMVVKIDAKEALAPVNNLKNVVSLVGIVEFFAILAIIWGASKSISDPIEKLRKGVEIITKGNLNYKVGTSAKDEIGELSRAFDNMLGQLNESQQRYIDLIESTPICVKVYDASGQLVFINEGGRKEHSLGINDNILKWDWFATISDGYREMVREKFNKALKGEKSIVEFEHLSNTGKNEWDSSYITPIKDKDGKVISVIIYSLDVSKLKEAELNLEKKIKERTKELAESENRYRTLVDLSPDVFVVHADEKVIFINNAGVKLLGANSVEDIVGKPISKFIYPDSLKVARKRIKETLKFGKIQPLVYEKFIKMDGSFVDVEVTSVSITFQGKLAVQTIARDISERKKSEDLLRQSYVDLEKFRLAVENASDHVIITNREGMIIYANKAAEKLTGYTWEEMNGKKASLWGKQMPIDFYADMWKIIKEDKKSFSGELVNCRKNGQLYEAELRISPIFDEFGNVEYFVGIERDISKMKKIDRVRSEFVSIVSHQLQTPLTSIKWVIERLLKDKSHSEKTKEYFEDIHISVERLSNIVSDLINVSRIESGASISVNPVKINLVEFINSSIREWSILCEKKSIQFYFLRHPEILDIETDKGILGNIFQSLVSNAIEYTPENGKIEISVVVKKDSFILSVNDTGIGIPKADQENIFKKFSRARNAKLIKPNGSGIGLYIANELVKLLDGRIWFESEENNGTTFYIEFPIKSVAKKGEKTVI